jgi:hypothetical protein
MDIHKNARLSFCSREALIKFVLEQGGTRKAAAAVLRVSAKTAAKWVVLFSLPASMDSLNPPPPVVHYEHPKPGDMLHLNMKGRRASLRSGSARR